MCLGTGQPVQLGHNERDQRAKLSARRAVFPFLTVVAGAAAEV